jgi:hypothetical protein
MVDDNHLVTKEKPHNGCGRNASRKEVIKKKHEIKEQAKTTDSRPCVILQNSQDSMTPATFIHMPTKEAQRQIIVRARKGSVKEPGTLDEFVTAPNQFLVDREDFLVKDSKFGTNLKHRTILFCTKANIQCLADADFWISDGTFRIVPTIFYQLYSVHAPVGLVYNQQVLPLAYALMTGKTEECYIRLIQDLKDFAAENGVLSFAPPMVITDFEQAMMHAVKKEFPSTSIFNCFFHLAQCVWRKTASLGLSPYYGNDADFAILVRSLPALAFLHPDAIPDAFAKLKAAFPTAPPTEYNVDAASIGKLLIYFEENYVLGREKQYTCSNQRHAPTFPPSQWSVYERVNNNFPRTQNIVESWHCRMGNLVGISHVGVNRIIQEFQREQNNVNLTRASLYAGAAAPKKKLITKMREDAILRVIKDGPKDDMIEYLGNLAHNFLFHE